MTAPKPAEDNALMLAYAAGDSAAFEALYQRHSGKVYAYLKRKLGSAEEADEVFQKVFLKIHQARAKFDPAYPFGQWLFVIAKTAVLDHYRKQGRQVPTAALEEAGEAVGADLSQNTPEPALKGEKELAVLAGLPADQQAALRMRVVEERSYGEIAQALKKTEQNVRQLVSRALRKLRVE